MLATIFKEINSLPIGGTCVRSDFVVDNGSTLKSVIEKFGRLRLLVSFDMDRVVIEKFKNRLTCFKPERELLPRQFSSREYCDPVIVYRSFMSETYVRYIRGVPIAIRLPSSKTNHIAITSLTNDHMVDYTGFSFLGNISKTATSCNNVVHSIELDVSTIHASYALMSKIVLLLYPGITYYVLTQLIKLAGDSFYVTFSDIRKFGMNDAVFSSVLYRLIDLKIITDIDTVDYDPANCDQTSKVPIHILVFNSKFYHLVHKWLAHVPLCRKGGFQCVGCGKTDTWTMDLTCSDCNGKYDTLDDVYEDVIDLNSYIRTELDYVHECVNRQMSVYIEKRRFVTEDLGRISYPQWECKRFCQAPDTVDYRSNDNDRFPIKFQPSIKLRTFQLNVLKCLFSDGGIKNTVLDLPCGSGKTCIAIAAIVTIQRPTLIIANTNESRQQIRRELLRFTTIPPEFIHMTGEPLVHEPKIVLTTYINIQRYSDENFECEDGIDLRYHKFFLTVYDEVQSITATFNRLIPTYIDTQVSIGMSGTLPRVEEVSNILNSYRTLRVKVTNLVAKKYICPVLCTLVKVSSASNHVWYNSTTPEKLICAMSMVKSIMKSIPNCKILMFVANIDYLKKFCTNMNHYLFLYGNTTTTERDCVYNEFRTNPKINVLCVSSIGDTSIDLPICSVVINVSGRVGSEIQPAQRVGRASRVYPGKEYGLYFQLVSSSEDALKFGRKSMRYIESLGYSTQEVDYEGTVQMTNNTLI